MADEVVMNGSDRTLDISENEDPKASKLLEKIVALEHEKSDLVTENETVRERITKLEGEIEVHESEKTELRREIVGSDADKKSFEARVEELTKKLEDLEVRERDLIAEIGEKENEIRELNLVVTRNGEEREKFKKERDELEGAKSWLEGLLVKSEKRVHEMEEKIGQLSKELEVSELVISGLKEKTLDGFNGIYLVENGGKSMYGPKLQSPVLAVSTGLVVTIGALWYLRARQK